MAPRLICRPGSPPIRATGFFHGHLSWHLSLCEIQAGTGPKLSRFIGTPWRSTGTAAGRNRECRIGAAFLWRSELAGHPRDAGRLARTARLCEQRVARRGQRARRPA